MPHVVADAGLLDVNGTLIAEVIAFILLVLILARWVYPPIIRVATERESKIAAGVRASEEAERRLAAVQEQVEQTLNEARSQAREIVGRAHREAVVEAEDVRRTARAEAEALVQRAQSDIAAERDRAIQALRNEVSTLVVDVASKVIGDTLDRETHQRLVTRSLDEMADGQKSKARSN
jgi:F-type H+-transporting ATPase subunit b